MAYMAIGSSYTFCPGFHTQDWCDRRKVVTGRVVLINRAHRWFLVEAPLGSGVLRECFKF